MKITKKWKCAICKKPTTWDESYGREMFLICPACYDRLVKDTGNDKAWNFILAVGWLMEEKRG